MTKSYGATKGNLRLAARYLGSKRHFDEDLESQIKLDDYMKQWYNTADKLAKDYDTNPNILDSEYLTPEEKEICDLAKVLDGVFTNYGQHAAGTIISKDRVTDILPLRFHENKDDPEMSGMTTQCTMGQAEAKGLLKMDFLNLVNLNIITEIMRYPTNKEDVDNRLQDYAEREKILRDPAIYKEIFCKGLTQGIFQFESTGMKNMLMEFQPESFEDIILLVAAYRPGPIDYIPEIIASKWYEKRGKVGKPPKKSIQLQNQTLQNILEPTYGCPIYQEQIMQIFQQMAGYSLGGADVVRRYMSKKKEEPLKKEKHAFIYGDEERGIPGCMKLQGLTEKEADDLFEQMMPFAKYGFNKSHATAYAMVALFTAYQKLYHTSDFFRVSMKYIKELKELPPFIQEMSAFGLSMRGPSLSKSDNEFRVQENGKAIRFGLRYIKGFSDQYVVACDSVEEFMELNPTVSVSVIEKYAKLGLFKECWKSDMQTSRVHGNRHVILQWIKDNAEDIRKISTYENSQDEKLQEWEATELALASETDPNLRHSLEVTAKRQAKSAKDWEEKRNNLLAVLEQRRLVDTANGPCKLETVLERQENRAWEKDMLSMPFSIEDSMQRLKNAANTADFSLLKGSRTDLARIPAIVLSVSDVKKTKSGRGEYYEVSLMDRNYNIINRRFDHPLRVLDGEFLLQPDATQYYTCKESDARNIRLNPVANTEQRPVQVVLPNTPPEQKLAAILQSEEVEVKSVYYVNGKKRERIRIVSVPVQQEEENDRDDDDFVR